MSDAASELEKFRAELAATKAELARSQAVVSAYEAMIAGLNFLGPAEEADVYTDSALVVNTLTKWAKGWERNGWRRRDGEVKNLDLVREGFALAQERPLVHITWIRAHDGSRWNEYADSLSTAYKRSEV